MSTTQEHWEQVYGSKAAETVSWFQAEPSPSLAIIAAAGANPEGAIIDVGAGASALVDHLLDRGFRHVSVLDVSSQALAEVKARLGERAALVNWLVEDITTWRPPAAAFDLWHDRAVFHFLIDAADRQAYLRTLERALRPGGHVILATFALDGPERCSGLPVQRYSPQMLAAILGPRFALIDARPETHLTPGGASQSFVWCLFRKTADGKAS
ncbi:MAG: methyltransferase domain-containing protein [Phenylobacterium sp.]|uniref:class I SAM-dependent methyltransferase n=1 Tax=Phenylobacterium sp. TaxID=1871053 RepID=UPI0025F2361C|nr:class I SAM-dependent methyltransferase [Phenylobacterium sp.]MBI1198958.1 methyltransferase domain-containing protein [Phenylobacterium sp.]